MRVVYKPEDQEVIDQYQEAIHYWTRHTIEYMLKDKGDYMITTRDYENINRTVLNDPYISSLKDNLRLFISLIPYTMFKYND